MATRALSYLDSVNLLESYGIETPMQVMVRDDAQYEAAMSGRLAYPLVLKAVPKDAGHKSDKQLVMTGLHARDEADEAYAKIKERAAGTELECFAVQQQVRGIEFIVGGKSDEVFGQTVVFGMGGVYIDLTSDFSVRVCPVDLDSAYEMLLETKARAFFSKDGFRGLCASRNAGAHFISKVSQILQDNRDIREMDINPVIAAGDRFFAVDVRIILEENRTVKD